MMTIVTVKPVLSVTMTATIILKALRIKKWRSLRQHYDYDDDGVGGDDDNDDGSEKDFNNND
jgi:hypothetical protein